MNTLDNEGATTSSSMLSNRMAVLQNVHKPKGVLKLFADKNPADFNLSYEQKVQKRHEARRE